MPGREPSTRNPLSRANRFAVALPPWTMGPVASAFQAWLHGLRGGQHFAPSGSEIRAIICVSTVKTVVVVEMSNLKKAICVIGGVLWTAPTLAQEPVNPSLIAPCPNQSRKKNSTLEEKMAQTKEVFPPGGHNCRYPKTVGTLPAGAPLPDVEIPQNDNITPERAYETAKKFLRNRGEIEAIEYFERAVYALRRAKGRYDKQLAKHIILDYGRLLRAHSGAYKADDLENEFISHNQQGQQPTSGKTSSSSKHLNDFNDDLVRRVKRAWFPPKLQAPEEARASCRIDRNGRMTDLKLERSSSTAIADDAIMKAITNSAPFRPLPSDLNSVEKFVFIFSYSRLFPYGRVSVERQPAESE